MQRLCNDPMFVLCKEDLKHNELSDFGKYCTLMRLNPSEMGGLIYYVNSYPFLRQLGFFKKPKRSTFPLLAPEGYCPLFFFSGRFPRSSLFPKYFAKEKRKRKERGLKISAYSLEKENNRDFDLSGLLFRKFPFDQWLEKR